ncbi:MAG: prepilin-type N-terminal cleavage/methylation domain-containing protein [Candidatus Azambacteria bacterium]|nr:prepilin-type N-terminal cleavage/methylation domain-containing protein [Candidatus Azambacteria bacterium]
MFTRQKYNTESGLTLIELLVALGIFSLVLLMIFGVFGLALKNQRHIVALRNVEDNVRFAMDSMSREIRTGSGFSSGLASLTFTNAKGVSVIYRLNNNTIEKSSAGGEYLKITGLETTVDYLKFYLSGQALGDTLQPRISIAMGATSRVSNQSSNLKIQTTVSARLLQN